MTKREAAEIIIKDCGTRASSICKKCPFNHIECTLEQPSGSDCLKIGVEYLKYNPVDDWQELKIDDLPRDILVLDYEFHEGSIGLNLYGKICDESAWYIISMIDQARRTGKPCHKFYYRKRQPEKKQPSHEEIMTLWWKITTQGRWVRVIEYKESGMYRLSDDTWCVPEFLSDKESATIPPETKQ